MIMRTWIDARYFTFDTSDEYEDRTTNFSIGFYIYWNHLSIEASFGKYSMRIGVGKIERLYGGVVDESRHSSV